MRAFAGWFFAFLWMFYAVACMSSVSTPMDCNLAATEDLGQEDTGGGDTDVTEEEGWAGTPCETDPECGAGHACVTQEFLAGLGLDNPDIDVPNGMCSMLACASDEVCGPQSTCFDTTPLTGMPISICLRECVDIVECRWKEGYMCYKLLPEDELGACLPDSLVVAIVCDDGHCDEGGDQ